ncbi:MAG: dihydroorotate dehydrogenase electron transfer subunit [Candidatus Micrarchaeota archaeon]
MLHQKAKIIKVEQEGGRVKTFCLDLELMAEPGQFVMVWIPMLDEKPFCVAGVNPLKLSVAKVGPFSSKMHELKVGEFVWVRGPFGKGFRLKGKKVIMVGGGYGVAPLRFLEEKANENGIKVLFIMGAKTCTELMKKPEARTLNVCTDDGSEGMKGFVTEYLEVALKEKVDCVYACGPEKMLVKVLEICEKANVECQLSLERYMKCGIGLCGQCSCGGLIVCKDGPVFTGKELKGISDFGKRRLDATGKMIEA